MNLSAQKRSRLAAAFAISNMGQKVPDDVAETKWGWSPTPESAVDNLAGAFMETDEHERIFHKEAKYWSAYIREISQEELLRIHGSHSPWIQQILDAPEKDIK